MHKLKTMSGAGWRAEVRGPSIDCGLGCRAIMPMGAVGMGLNLQVS